jgi:hypothetical protein
MRYVICRIYDRMGNLQDLVRGTLEDYSADLTYLKEEYNELLAYWIVKKAGLECPGAPILVKMVDQWADDADVRRHTPGDGVLIERVLDFDLFYFELTCFVEEEC